MSSKIKAVLSFTALLLGSALPASAAMDVDNTGGRYNGHYKCTVTIKRPQHENEVQETSLDLDERQIIIHCNDGDVVTRYDTMVDYGYKTEIDAHDPKDKKVRYRIKIDGNVVR